MLNDKQKLKACAYVRVSTRSEHQRQSFDQQIEYWKSYLFDHPIYEFLEVYSDYGYSGKINNRPAYKRMINDALEGKIDIIFTKSIARFGRNMQTISSDLLKLKEHNVFVVFEIENIFTKETDPFSIHLHSIIYENELYETSRSIKFGFQEKFKSGSALCKPLFGYNIKKVHDDYEFTIIPDQAETVRYIYEMYLKGHSFTQIAKILTDENRINKNGSTVWYPPMIPYILSNEKYMGSIYLQKYYNKNFKSLKNDVNNPKATMYAIDNHHEPIISESDFWAAQEKLASRPKRTHRNTTDESDVISELLYCEICKNPYKRIIRKNYAGDSVITYRCGKNRYKEESCYNSTIYPETFKKLFVKAYNQFMKIDTIGTYETNVLNVELAMIESSITDLIQTHKLGNIAYSAFNKQMHKLLNDKVETLDKLHHALGHFVNGKKLPSKTTLFNDKLAKKALNKVFVNKNLLLFEFRNGIVIEKEFTNPAPGKKRSTQIS